MNGKIDFSKAKLINQDWNDGINNFFPIIEVYIVGSSMWYQNNSLVFRVKINRFTEDQKKSITSIGTTLKSNKNPFLLEVFNICIQNICGVDYYIIQTKFPYEKTVSKYHIDNNCMLEEYCSQLQDLIGCYEFALKLNLPLSVCIDDISVALVKNRSSPFPQICLTPYSFLTSFINQINNISVHIHSPFFEIFEKFDLNLSPFFNVESCYPEVIELLSQDKNAFEAIKSNELLNHVKNMLSVPSFDINLLFKKELCGFGSYGSVLLMEGNDETVFAMKESNWINNGLLYKESFILNSMNHRNIVKCFGYCEENLNFTVNKNESIYPHGFMLMEYCKFGDLETYLGITKKKGNMTLEEIQIIFGQIAFACFYVHFEKRYVHRDLKLANILVNASDPFVQIKLCDFGFARSLDVLMMTFIGTKKCAAIEILENVAYDDRSDLFSLGCILYYLLYGTYPCEECRTISEIIKKVKAKDINFEIELEDIQQFNEIIELIKDLLNLTERNMTWEQFRDHSFVVESTSCVNKKYELIGKEEI